MLITCKRIRHIFLFLSLIGWYCSFPCFPSVYFDSLNSSLLLFDTLVMICFVYFIALILFLSAYTSTLTSLTLLSWRNRCARFYDYFTMPKFSYYLYCIRNSLVQYSFCPFRLNLKHFPITLHILNASRSIIFSSVPIV